MLVVECEVLDFDFGRRFTFMPFCELYIFLRKIPYSLVEARRKNVLAHAARFCRASARIVYASSFLRFRISLGLNSEPSKPHKNHIEEEMQGV